MTRVTYTEPDGTERAIEVAIGQSVMEGAVHNDLDGILAECGGACACATCHVYVDPAWMDRIPPASEAERDMLELAEDVRPTSRLSCQIQVSDEIDGLRVTIAGEA